MSIIRSFRWSNLPAAIIFDTMGRHFLDLKKSTLFVLGAEYSKELGADRGTRRAGRTCSWLEWISIGPRSDFAGFARQKIPFLFFSHATHKDYHGAGDRPELLDYPKLTRRRDGHRAGDRGYRAVAEESCLSR